MKKTFILLFFSYICLFPAFSKSVYITIITTDDKKILLQQDDGNKDFVLYSSDSNELNGKNIKNIEGFDQLKEVENIEIYGIKGIEDFSFLDKLPYLKYLHISGCSVFSLRFLSELENIEVLELYITPGNKYNIQNEAIDFSKLKKLKKIVYRDGLGKIPNFINVPSFPELDLSNNNISSISEDKLRLLNQYSKVDLSFNPITENCEGN